MMWKGLLVGAAAFVLGAGPAGNAEQDLKELQGDWRLTDMVRSGQHVDLKARTVPTMVRVDGGTLTLITELNSQVTRVVVRPGETFGEIDLTPTYGPRKGVKL